ncbi:MAG: SAM-dependent chlorinase/fluorinase [Cyanobacteria bacterium REEB459]|nr:SAM-dependent chlorinase/fluorinase [Cyanobacteria bacterium REEB459]
MITLMTDFGLQDVYVGVIKGVIASHSPTTPLIDLTHNIAPQDCYGARFQLLNAFPYFPPGTIHLVIVDPGVGGHRRAIAVQLAGAYLVGPDNGVFSGVCDDYPVLQAVELDRPLYWRTPTPSPTFHGRDIFAPAAAHLAAGVPLTALGTPISPTSLKRLELPPGQPTDRGIEGCIQAIDHFGNAITTLPSSRLDNRPWQVQLGATVMPGVTTYSSVPEQAPLALVGSHGWIEIALNQGRAEAVLGLKVGQKIQLIWPQDHH